MLQTSPRVRSPFTIPPLENGDRLSRAEFERRYAAMTNCKAELIEGTVYMASALRAKSHGQPHSLLNAWLTVYRIAVDGLIIADAPTVRLDAENEPQPDLALLIDPAYGGQAGLTPDDYIEGAPELLAEIAASTVSIDMGAKKSAYELNGVQEYLVWRVLDRAIDWFYLQDGQYVDLSSDEDGISRSQIFPGLWLDREALIRDDMPRVMAVLQSGLSSPEHDLFAQAISSKVP